MLGHNNPPISAAELQSQIEQWLGTGYVARGAVRDNLAGALREIKRGSVHGAFLPSRRAARNCGNVDINRWALGLRVE